MFLNIFNIWTSFDIWVDDGTKLKGHIPSLEGRLFSEKLNEFCLAYYFNAQSNWSDGINRKKVEPGKERYTFSVALTDFKVCIILTLVRIFFL